MNNRFKFRLWDNVGKTYIAKNAGFSFTPDGNVAGSLKPEEIVIEQCTGLKDKTGKLIYEGDIIGNSKNRHTIVWSVEEACCKSKQADCHIDQKWITDCGFIIIGNIHENHKLLEVKNGI